MKFFSFKSAPNVRKVMIYLRERGVETPFETIEVDIMNGEQNTPEFRAINPLGKVPALQLDDGTFVTESLPIVEYFEETLPGGRLMLGDTPEERAKIRSIERYIEMEITGTMGIMAHNMMPIYTVRFGESPEVVEYARRRQAMALDFLDNFIGDRSFVYGDGPTLADISLFVTLESAFLVNAEIEPKYENIIRCYENFSKRSSVAL
ncbi:glutathione S-transferase family protein [Emcibacter sp.]|uniref:glutathione S-transferase family protein n=1 Tax=Emcibacter sp. TaxID=1979954 RepID=UPI002AA72812|nr:glutathione S-transferase family protein [Emcibacter sp.]